jgi:hypothetical protein
MQQVIVHCAACAQTSSKRRVWQVPATVGCHPRQTVQQGTLFGKVTLL